MVGDEEFPSRSFLLYWQANAVSAFGSYMTLLALQTVVVLTLHGSAIEVGWLTSARWLPYDARACLRHPISWRRWRVVASCHPGRRPSRVA
jgi:hypothetical protein